MSLTLKPRDDSANGGSASRQEKFDAAMGEADSDWVDYIKNNRITDKTKIAAAELLALLVEALTTCRNPEDVGQLRQAFEAQHGLTTSPELAAIVSAAANLDPSQQGMLVQTIHRVGNGDLRLTPDGAAMRPRQLGQQSQGNQGQQGSQPGQQSQGNQGQQGSQPGQKTSFFQRARNAFGGGEQP